jgi:hypothetical protein
LLEFQTGASSSTWIDLKEFQFDNVISLVSIYLDHCSNIKIHVLMFCRVACEIATLKKTQLTEAKLRSTMVYQGVAISQVTLQNIVIFCFVILNVFIIFLLTS